MRNLWRAVALVVFVGYPLVELLVAIWVAQYIGWTYVILLMCVGFVAGVTMLRRAPVSGILIAIPGFVTDVIGLVLLITPIRKAIGAGAMNSLRKRLGLPESRQAASSPYLRPDPDHPVVPGEVIEGDFVD